MVPSDVYPRSSPMRTTVLWAALISEPPFENEGDMEADRFGCAGDKKATFREQECL